MAKNVAWFSEVNRKDLGLVGGKGGNLGEMVQAGLPVPDGFIVTSEAYFSFLERTQIKQQVIDLITGINANDSVRLKEVSTKIKELIRGAQMPEDIKQEIAASYAQLGGDDTFVAVRSSATAEDLPGASFAGQQATYLNIHGADHVVDAVQRCWASLFEARAIFYREDKGFNHMDVGIAVPVQRMVQSVKSGIMFTVDPITNDRAKLVIEAGFGLGEAVVSGSITPDRYIVDKATLHIDDKEINEQAFKIVRKAKEAAAPAPTPEPVAAQPEVPAAPAPVQFAPEPSVPQQPEQAAAPVIPTPPAPQAAPVMEQPAPEAPVQASTGDPASGGEEFVLREADLKADLDAIKDTYAQSKGVNPDDGDNQTLTSTRAMRNLTLTFTGEPDAVGASVPTAGSVVAKVMTNDDGEADAFNVEIMLAAEEANAQKLTDEEIVALAKVGKQIEEHYNYPQDTEWAIEDGKIYIVQARPITTLEDSIQPAAPEASTTQERVVILKGGGASVGMASGPVKVIHSPSEIDKILEGDILVTEMTTPDFVPAMKRAAAIITDTGGRTCHAAIVSRELQIPCVVGTKEATAKLQTGQILTVDGTRGLVYEGRLEQPKPDVADDVARHTGSDAPITATKVYVNLAEKDLAEKVSHMDVDGVGLLRAEFMIAEIGEHPKKMIAEGRGAEFVDKLANGLLQFAAPFFPRPVIYRATDFKTNEYRNLKGGDQYEPVEDNPMIGYRGCGRYLADPDVFKLEIEAIRRVREEYDNLHVMIPFVRTVQEMRDVKQLMEDNGLKRSKNFKLYMMVEVPSTVFLIDQFCEIGIDGVSIGSNDLTQLILGVDRDSELVAGTFDERNEAVLMAMDKLITSTNKYGVVASICGQAPSVYPEITEKLVELGINSISVSPDMIDKTRRTVASVEKKMLLKRLASISEQEREELALLKR